MIVVFGSINVDLTFMVERQPALGETVLCPSYLASPGGKGANQAVAAAQAGAETRMIGCVGRDHFAAPALATMKDAGVNTDNVAEVETPTGCATICVDADAENAIVVASGANQEVRATQVPDALLGPDTLLLMQMEIPFDQNWALLKRAHALGARTALNVAPAAQVPSDMLDALDFLIVNEIEGAMIATASGIDPNPPNALAQRLALRHKLTCILTLGGKGAVLEGPDDRFWIPALPVTPLDTTGAGDTFVGFMAAGLNAGLQPADAARRASTAAAIACTKPGAQTAIPTASEIDDALESLPPVQPT